LSSAERLFGFNKTPVDSWQFGVKLLPAAWVFRIWKINQLSKTPLEAIVAGRTLAGAQAPGMRASDRGAWTPKLPF
jgi:hypothetical protein